MGRARASSGNRAYTVRGGVAGWQQPTGWESRAAVSEMGPKCDRISMAGRHLP